MPHAVFIEHRARPARRDDVFAVWERHMAPAVAANVGHLGYYYCFDSVDADVIRVFQMYTDADAAAAFLETPEYLDYLTEVEPLLNGPPVVHAATPMWSKGFGDPGCPDPAN